MTAVILIFYSQPGDTLSKIGADTGSGHDGSPACGHDEPPAAGQDEPPAAGHDQPPASGPVGGPLSDPVAEARRVIDAARAQNLTVRVLGGVAVHMRSPMDRPLLPRPLKDIDLVIQRKEGRATAQLLEQLEYLGEEMFNALHGSRRQLYLDQFNDRQLDVFVGGFAMCHELPISERLDRHPYTVPLAELLLTKLQIVQLNERDERDIYSLLYHHELTETGGEGIETPIIASLCAEDWGLWRTSRGTIERCAADLVNYPLELEERDRISERLKRLWERLDAAPKTGRWKRRSRLGERKRWYQEPEEV